MAWRPARAGVADLSTRAIAELTARRYARLKSLVLELWTQGPASRRRVLQARGAGPRTAADVQALLDPQNRRSLTGVLQRATAAPPDPPPPPNGLRLGPWTIVGEIGVGGMGHVMAAERSDGLYRQRAAVKLLRGVPDAEALARFTRERQILARLQHVHIARLLDGGTTAGGQPYLVMEHIDGEPIDRWCARTRATLPAILAVVDQVCAALVHAHQRLVVHCDIKPSNVLVDRDGCVRLLDFGIARLQEEAGPWSPAMTPAWASPEQRAGEAPGVPSDLFSLGRLVAELVRGQALGPGRRRELEAILARATAARPEDRYPDVTSFCADLRSFQRRQPVQAMRGTSLRWHRYRLANHWRRWWAAWGAGALVVAVLAAFTARVISERDRARAAERRATSSRDQAAHEAAVARQVSDFAVSLFEGADSRKRLRAADTPVRELLARGRERLDRLRDDPALQARLLEVLGTVDENLGQVDVAAKVYEDALRVGRAAGDVDARRADLLYKLAFTLNRQGRYGRALRCAQELLALRSARGTSDVALADASNAMGVVLTNLGQLDAAATHLATSLRLRERALGPQSDQVSQVEGNLALLALARRRWDEAEDWVTHAQRIDDAAGRASPARSRRLVVLALAQEGRGQRGRAEALLEEAAEDARRRFGRDGAPLHRVLRELGRIQADEGRTGEARRTLQEALRAARDGGDDHNPVFAVTLARHAGLMARQQRVVAARAEFARARAAAIVDGEPEPWAVAEIDRLASATAVSAPGTGERRAVRARPPASAARRR